MNMIILRMCIQILKNQRLLLHYQDATNKQLTHARRECIEDTHKHIKRGEEEFHSH